MDKKFIKIISPFSLVIISTLDIAVIIFSIFAVKKIIESANVYTIIFVIIDLIAVITAFLATKEIFSNGIVFEQDKLEFTGIDENNIFSYADIMKVETQRDTSASLRKNFIDRYSVITLYLKDDSVASVQLGMTTGKKLEKIKKEIDERIK